MYHIYLADADTYITNKVISGESKVSSSVGYAGTLDFYKLYKSSDVLDIELTRGLIHFDYSQLKSLYQGNLIDIDHPSFKCYLNLKDVYGGQPTPSNFNLIVAPLSRSFNEGFGKDIVHFTDYDVANFESSSIYDGEWVQSGANKGDSWNSFTACDYFTNADFGVGNINLVVTQSFKQGTEDLNVDVTHIVSATLAGNLPDSGFRISFTGTEENDTNTYFVKRFATRHAYNTLLQPRLITKFDDSILDTAASLNLNSSGSLFLYNYENEEPSNLTSGSSYLTGSNCIGLTLKTKVSSGSYYLNFTGSQFSRGNCVQSGTYYADVFIDSTPLLLEQLNSSGSVKFTPIWHSLDGSLTYVTGSVVEVHKQTIYSSPLGKKKFVVSISGIPSTISRAEKSLARVNIFDSSDPLMKPTRFAVNQPGKVIKKCYYSIRDSDTSEVIVPFDENHNSTRVSSDETGMYFYVDGMSLLPKRTYVIDIKVKLGNDETIYKDVSTIFEVLDEM